MSQPGDQPQRPDGPPPANPLPPNPAVGGPPPVAGQPAAPHNPYSAPQQLAGPAHQVAGSVSGNFVQTRAGITVVYYGLNVVALGIIFALVVVLGDRFGFQGQMPFSEQLIWLAAVITLVGIVMMFIGPFFCMSVPPETGGRPLVIISVILSCASIVLFAFVVFSGLLGGLGQVGPAGLMVAGLTPMLSSLLGMSGTILFVIFLGKLAAYVGRRNLIWLATITVIADIFLLVMPLLVLLMGVRVAANAPAGAGPGGIGEMSTVLAMILGCGAPLFGLIGLLTYVNLLRSLRKHLSLPQFQG